MHDSMDRSVRDAHVDISPVKAGETGQNDLLHAGGPDAHFEIHVDIERQYLKLTVRGEWNDAEFETYAQAYRRAIATLMAHGGLRYVLTDASEYGVLTTELADRMAMLARSVNQMDLERGAIITSSIINQAQSRDISNERGIRYFRKMNQALAWLFSEEA